MTSVASERSQWLRTAALVVLLGYWLVIFAGTHLPPSNRVPPITIYDKVLHGVAYAGLAFLVAFNVTLRRPLSWRHCLAIVLALAVWGTIDEATQIPVGRDADLFDWMADLMGIAAGLMVFLIAAAPWRASRVGD